MISSMWNTWWSETTWFLAREHRVVLHDNSMQYTDIKAYKLYRADDSDVLITVDS